MANDTMPPAGFEPPSVPPSYSGPVVAPDFRGRRAPKWLISLIIGVIILIIGAGIALASRIWDPVWNPFRPSPEKVIEEMRIKMEGVKTFRTKTEARIAAEERRKEMFEMYMIFEGDSDITDPNNLKSRVDFDIVITEKQQGSFVLAGQSRSIGQASYFKLSSLDLPGTAGLIFAFFGFDMDKIKNQWIKIDKQSLSTLMGSPVPGQEASREQQEKMMAKLQKVFKETKIYQVKKELSDAKINGNKMYHYLLVFDKQGLEKTIGEIFEISLESSGQPLKAEGLSTDLLLGGFKQSISEVLDKIGEITAEIWIGKKDLYLYKIKFDKKIELGQFEQVPKGETSIKEGEISIKFEVDYSKFNQSVKIEAPENFITLEEMFGPKMEMYK